MACAKRSNMKWSEAKTLQFLDLYKKHECLWNRKSNNYNNRDARNSALEAIISEMDINVTANDMKNKIKSVRTMYKKELTLVLKSKKSRAGITELLYTPKLIWFNKADTFLRSMSTTRNSISMERPMASEEFDDEDSTHEDIFDGDTSETYEISPVLTPEDGTALRPPKVRKESSSLVAHKLSATNETTDKFKPMDVGETLDEFDYFGKLIAAQIRKMPEYDAIECQEKIHSVISKRRLLILTNDSHSSPRRSHSRAASAVNPLAQTFSIREGINEYSNTAAVPNEEVVQSVKNEK